MGNENDKLIMELREKIKQKKKALKEQERFIPLTLCQIVIDGVKINIHTLDRQRAIALLVKLNNLFNSAKELGYEEEYEISGFKISDWMEDLKFHIAKLEKSKKIKELEADEKKLEQLLSNDKKVELQLDEIKDRLK